MNIALFYGSNSCEHEISILSTLQIMKHFKNDTITLVYISKDNKFYIGECLKDYEFYTDINLKKCKEVRLIKKNQEVYLQAFLHPPILIDMIFPILHGTSGEDGCIQGMLELLDIPYAQSKLSTCAICMDKDLTKKMFKAVDLPTTPFVTIYKQQVLSNLDLLKKIKIEKPWIIKPSHGGSSIGINCVYNDEYMAQKICESFAFDHKVIIEHKLENCREFNIAILGDECEQIFSNIEEVHVHDDFYSYTDKYGGSTTKQTPTTRTLEPNIDEKLMEEIKQMALKAFLLFECSGVVRFDFLYTDHLILNEINIIPGSYSIYLYKNIIEPNEMIEMIKNIALNQYHKKQKEIRTLDSFIFKKNWNQYIKK